MGVMELIAIALLAADLTLASPDLTCRVRDPKTGVVVRSRARRTMFWRATGYPKGRPGYVVDHLVPLACGGCDLPSNMQWLTIEEWRAKTKWERRPCSAWFDGANERRRK